MKKTLILITCMTVFMAFTGCHKNNGLSVPDVPTTLTPSTSIETATTTTPPAMTVPTKPVPVPDGITVIMPSAQGGDMLYPTYYDINLHPDYTSWETHTLMGIIDQKGTVLAAPQFDSFMYYKNSDGKIQYIITTGNGKATVFDLDGSIYMQFDAFRVEAYDGFPYLTVYTDLGEDIEDPGKCTVYDLQNGKRVLTGTYGGISFADSHTAILSDTNDDGVRTADYLHDFNDPSHQKIRFKGELKDLYDYWPPYVDTATCFPATAHYFSEDDLVNGTDYPTVYLGRDGKQLAGEQGIKPNIDTKSYYGDWFCGTEEGTYTWVTEGDKVGYQDKNGGWVYQTSKYGFLED